MNLLFNIFGILLLSAVFLISLQSLNTIENEKLFHYLLKKMQKSLVYSHQCHMIELRLIIFREEN